VSPGHPPSGRSIIRAAWRSWTLRLGYLSTGARYAGPAKSRLGEPGQRLGFRNLLTTERKPAFCRVSHQQFSHPPVTPHTPLPTLSPNMVAAPETFLIRPTVGLLDAKFCGGVLAKGISAGTRRVCSRQHKQSASYERSTCHGFPPSDTNSSQAAEPSLPQPVTQHPTLRYICNRLMASSPARTAEQI
jgi:hypothetical protein